jgi:hypothetical protein
MVSDFLNALLATLLIALQGLLLHLTEVQPPRHAHAIKVTTAALKQPA